MTRLPHASHSTRRLIRQSTELAVAAPAVVAHRLTQMARAGLAPGPADHAELQRMTLEKVAAFQQGWMAMWLEAWRWPWSLWSHGLPGARPPRGSAWEPWLRVAAAGLAPVHRKATANARRLGRRRP